MCLFSINWKHVLPFTAKRAVAFVVGVGQYQIVDDSKSV